MNDLYQNKGGEVQTSFSFSSDVLAKALQRIYSQKMDVEGEIEPNLFHEICRILDDAAADGVAQSEGKQVDDFLQQLQTSNEVFAAFKVHRMQRDMARLLLDSNGTLKPFEKWVQEVTPIASHQVRHWLQTEYDTAVLRAHQAADWQQFLRERDVLPNLKWMPSTSLHPGADHRPYWNTIRPIDDPFWSKHRPGDRWNCKCDLTATDEEPTQLPDDDNNSKAQPGLDNNPGTDGILFSDSHPYFPNDCRHCAFYKPGFKDRVRNLFTNRSKDCYHCRGIRQTLENTIEKERIKANKAEYQRLLKDENYTDVVFNKKTGGLKATHVGHITHDTPKAERFFEGLTSSDLERECQDQLVAMGHKALFCDESKKKKGQQLPALDMIMDDRLMDIRSVTGKGWYSNIFVSKNDQLRRFNKREDLQDKANSLCLYFHNPELFNEEKMKKSINYFRFYRDKSGNLIDKDLKHIFCVIKGRTEIIRYDIE